LKSRCNPHKRTSRKYERNIEAFSGISYLEKAVCITHSECVCYVSTTHCRL